MINTTVVTALIAAIAFPISLLPKHACTIRTAIMSLTRQRPIPAGLKHRTLSRTQWLLANDELVCWTDKGQGRIQDCDYGGEP